MELLFKTECDNLMLYNSDKLIFKADNKFLDMSGKEVLAEGIENHVDLEKERYYEKDEKCGTSKVIVPISTKIPYEGENDDIGFYGYYDKEGNEVIKPQYSCAHDFAHGLACVSYDRENNYGFINDHGDIVIPMVYSYAWEFNKYGIVIVRKKGRCFPIDINGNKLYVPDVDYIVDAAFKITVYGEKEDLLKANDALKHPYELVNLGGRAPSRFIVKEVE